MSGDALLAALRAAVGEAQVLTGDGLHAWEVDWRRRWHGRARAVVRPGSTAEVAAVVRACAAARVALVPQGGNTGLVGGGVPDASGTQVLLSLQRMQRVRAVDTDNLALTVEAGCVLQAAQQAAAAHGLLLPLSLAAEGSCSIGGNLATNAGGTAVLRHGNARELCLGLEVVTAEGAVWDGLSGLRKDNTGYDLRHLFVGSEGTLGVITAATLRLVPAPAATVTALAACATLADAVALLALARRHLGDGLTGLEAMSAPALALVARHHPQLPQPLPGPPPWTVLVEHSASDDEGAARERVEALLGAALDSGCAIDAVVAGSLAQSRALWELRESIPLAQAAEGANVKHDIALPVSRLVDFVATADAAIATRWPGARLIDFGHLGDGNLHYNVQAPPGCDAAAFVAAEEPALNALVFDLVAARGGSFSAEHGIGALRRDELAQRESPVALDLMRRVKAALDPHGILNPGRML